MKIRIGSRGSALALWQAHHVEGLLEAAGHQVEIEVITTTGDRVQDRRLESVGGKGAFLKEIEDALLAQTVDLAVHSLKDVPTALPGGLSLCAILERADPRDAVITRDGSGLDQLPPGSCIGTTSLRRQSLLRDGWPMLRTSDLRGNVDTRIRRLHEGRYDAILLACAGLRRLGRGSEISQVLDPDTFLPAPGQGAIALECRQSDAAVAAATAFLDHPATARAVRAERAFLAAFGGGCNVPLGAHATAEAGQLRLRAFVVGADAKLRRSERLGADPEALGTALGQDLLAHGTATGA